MKLADGNGGGRLGIGMFRESTFDISALYQTVLRRERKVRSFDVCGKVSLKYSQSISLVEHRPFLEI